MNVIRRVSVLLCLVVSLVSLSSNVFSQTAQPQLISDIKVEAMLVDYPIYKVMNVPEKPWKQRKWIQIEVDFTTAASRKENQSLDNVTVEYELLMPTEDPRNPYVLLYGKVVYWAFALDGGQHHLIAFVPPRIIEKYTVGKKFTNADARKFDVKVEFKMNDTLIGTGYSLAKGTTLQATAKKFADAKTSLSLQRQKDGILGQDKTPWSFLNYDYYEQVNPDAAK